MDASFEHIGWMECEYIDVVFLFGRVDRGVPGSWMVPLDLGDGILLYLFYWFLSSIQRNVFECGSVIIWVDAVILDYPAWVLIEWLVAMMGLHWYLITGLVRWLNFVWFLIDRNTGVCEVLCWVSTKYLDLFTVTWCEYKILQYICTPFW